MLSSRQRIICINNIIQPVDIIYVIIPTDNNSKWKENNIIHFDDNIDFRIKPDIKNKWKWRKKVIVQPDDNVNFINQPDDIINDVFLPDDNINVIITTGS
jgi:hypothetical protein